MSTQRERGIRLVSHKKFSTGDDHVPRGMGMDELIITIRGAGEMASGIAHRLHSAGMHKIVMTEIVQPLCVRRTVSFSESVYEGEASVEGIRGVLIGNLNELSDPWKEDMVAVIVDPESRCISELKPDVFIDATMLKKETSLCGREARLIIGVGPGFTAPDNVHAVIESNRGHNLGRVIWTGSAEPYTGVPGNTNGITRERVLRASVSGTVKHVRHIGEMVKKEDTVLYVDEIPVRAQIDGILRGLIREVYVTANEKIGDIDPRSKIDHCYMISDKARAIAGGVLEVIMHKYNKLDL